MKTKRNDRNIKYKPWKPLIPFQVPEEAKKAGVVAVFQNNHVTIFIKETEFSAFTSPDGNPQKIAHIMIQWVKGLKGSDEYFYGLKQRIKREICGEQSEAVELFPADWREQDFGQTHIWSMHQGATFPIGIIPNDIEKAMSDIAGGRDNVITREDLELFVVRHNNDEEIVEVFDSEEECKFMYGDNVIPESSTYGIELIGDIPLESPSVAWTDKAKAKLANVMAKGKESVQSVEKVPELFSEVDTVEDEIFDKDVPRDCDDGDPIGLEEDLAIAEAMNKALSNKADERAKHVRKVSEEVVGKIKKGLDDIRNSSDKPRIIIP